MTHVHHPEHREHHKAHHHDSVHRQLDYIVEAAKHAKEHLAKGGKDDVAVAKDIIEHLISGAEALEAHASHL
jgi:hypothetical protein